jgi:glycosyltransferase involved in cell wall biosynthesis
MTDAPLISVIIPVYNGERYMAEALESVLAQDYRPLEIIVVNDGSSDRTEEIALSYPDVHYMRQTNGGAAAARNSGIKYSTGEYLAFLDADDLWTANKLRLQTGLFADASGLDMAFGHVLQFFSPEVREALEGKINITTGSMPGYLPGAMLVKRRSFLEVGFFDESLRVGEFIDWYARAVEMGMTGGLTSEVILKRRIHDANTGIRERDSRKDYLRVLRASLERRRSLNK